MLAVDSPSPKPPRWPIYFLAVVGLVAVIFWSATLYVFWWEEIPTKTDRGVFGDSFGAANALFSAGALITVSLAMLLQTREQHRARLEVAAEHRLQIVNLKLQRKTTLLQEKSQRTDSFLRIVDRLEDTRRDRVKVRLLMANGVDPRALARGDVADGRDEVERVCREFDILGLLLRERLIDDRLIALFYATAFVELFNGFLREYVDEIRKPAGAHKYARGVTHYWELVAYAERVKVWADAHPSVLGATDWPPGPWPHNQNSEPKRWSDSDETKE